MDSGTGSTPSSSLVDARDQARAEWGNGPENLDPNDYEAPHVAAFNAGWDYAIEWANRQLSSPIPAESLLDKDDYAVLALEASDD